MDCGPVVCPHRYGAGVSASLRRDFKVKRLPGSGLWLIGWMVLASLVASAIAGSGAAQDSAPPPEPPIDYVEEAWKVDGRRPRRQIDLTMPVREAWWERARIDELHTPALENRDLSAFAERYILTDDELFIAQSLLIEFHQRSNEIRQAIYDLRPFASENYLGVVEQWRALDAAFDEFLADLATVIDATRSDVRRAGLADLYRRATLDRLPLFCDLTPEVEAGDRFDLVRAVRAYAPLNVARPELPESIRDILSRYDIEANKFIRESLVSARETRLRHWFAQTAYGEKLRRDQSDANAKSEERMMREQWGREVARWEGWWQLSERFVEEVANSTDDPEDWIAHVRRLQFPVVHDRWREDQIRSVLNAAELDRHLLAQVEVLWNEVLQKRSRLEREAISHVMHARRHSHPILTPPTVKTDPSGSPQITSDPDQPQPLRFIPDWYSNEAAGLQRSLMDKLIEAGAPRELLKALASIRR